MSGVKLFGLGFRLPGMSLEEFEDYWRHPHGTLGRKMTTLRGYVQSHPVSTELIPHGPQTFDCIAEMWFDSEREVQELPHESGYAQFIEPDAHNFCDVPRAIFLAAAEEVLSSDQPLGAPAHPADALWSPESCPTSIKVLHFVGRDRQDAWAQSGDQDIGRQLGALRHVRCHPLRTLHPSPPYLGIHELWWPTLRALRNGVRRAPVAFQLLCKATPGSVVMIARAERYF